MKKILASIIVALLIIIYFRWFLHSQIIGGDWPYISNHMVADYPILAPLWTSQNGFGGINADFPIFSYQYFTIGLFVNIFHIPWEIVYKITWFGLFLFTGIIASYDFYATLKHNFDSWEITLAVFLYMANSYILMIVGGGQLGIGLAYAISPLVFARFIKGIKHIVTTNVPLVMIREGIIFGLLVSLQILFDSRMSYLTMGVVGMYLVYQLIMGKKIEIFSTCLYGMVAFVIVLFLHGYWILPFVIFKLLSIPMSITSTANLSFLSFADFSHTLAFLHPNWPENIFGKVYFLQPEFLIYPIIAFLGLTLPRKKNDNSSYWYYFFCFISMAGILLAKGTNDPFGYINQWLFQHIPGLNLYRDPTKYYLLIAISYSYMIPYSLSTLGNILDRRIRYYCFIFFTFLILFPLRNAILLQIDGTFSKISVPSEYHNLTQFISEQKTFSRTLWLPDQSEFRFESELHPLLTATDVYHTNNLITIVSLLQRNKSETNLQALSIKYIIIPDDTTHTIFDTNRVHELNIRDWLIRQLDKISWLKKQEIGKIVIYTVPFTKDHLWLSSGGKITYQKKGITDYLIHIKTPNPQYLTFTELYHPEWNAITNHTMLLIQRNSYGLMVIHVPQGITSIHLFFVPQLYQWYWYLISGLVLTSCVIFLLIFK